MHLVVSMCLFVCLSELHETQDQHNIILKGCITGPSGFLTFTDLYGLDMDILITFLSVLRIYMDLYAPNV